MVLAAVFTLFMLIPIKCVIKYDDVSFVHVKVMGIKVYSSDKKKKREETKTEDKKSGDRLTEFKNNIDSVSKMLKSLYKSAKKQLTVENIEFLYSFGLGDAAITGIYSGGVYAVVGAFNAFLLSNFKVLRHKVDILPDFNNNKHELKLLICVRVRVINLIRMLLAILFD